MCDVTGLRLSAHPARWRGPVTPALVRSNSLSVVAGGALAARTRSDALVAVDAGEARRRAVASLGSVRSLVLLDVLLSLPLDCPIPVRDLTEREGRILLTAPPGCVSYGASSVTRDLCVPTTVVAALVRGTGWRSSLRRAASFSAFTQRIVAVPSPPNDAAVLEAQLTGVGIWIEQAGEFEEFLAPEPFTPAYYKAAGWRFAEHAYQAMINTVPECRRVVARC
jgi:hypothetical protein